MSYVVQMRLLVALFSVDEGCEMTRERVEDRLTVHRLLPVLSGVLLRSELEDSHERDERVEVYESPLWLSGVVSEGFIGHKL
jgi:hypothetical protein